MFEACWINVAEISLADGFKQANIFSGEIVISELRS